jgi:hypothetical protein
MNTINNNVYRDISPQEDRMIIKYDNRNLKEKARPNENDNKRIKTRNKVAIERMMRERLQPKPKCFISDFEQGSC